MFVQHIQDTESHQLYLVSFCFNKEMDSPCKDQTIDNDILEGWFAKQSSGEHQKGVEPVEEHNKTSAQGQAKVPTPL